ncbi:hypothetical protein SFOMI_2671 [Sphingobium fuliginis]|uniref:Uncharacterized protein n=1 Tax=Sphingobium fuliginis (strain ATCC 27551) TaxID=336203 RepID=A0A292ZGS1_SPHSA|nr:hypothetical protein SFOMI_2671 [Sphingobium fuliginis]
MEDLLPSAAMGERCRSAAPDACRLSKPAKSNRPVASNTAY